MPLALPAVTVPSLPNAARSFARPSSVVSGLMWSSSETTSSPLRVLIVSGSISAAKRPSLTAFAPSWWLRSAYSSCASREMPRRLAIYSAVCAIISPAIGSESAANRLSCLTGCTPTGMP
jgi:hypothetical protein